MIYLFFFPHAFYMKDAEDNYIWMYMYVCIHTFCIHLLLDHSIKNDYLLPFSTLRTQCVFNFISNKMYFIISNGHGMVNYKSNKTDMSVFPVITAGYYMKMIHQFNVAYAATCCFYDLNNHQCYKHESITANNSKSHFWIWYFSVSSLWIQVSG